VNAPSKPPVAGGLTAPADLPQGQKVATNGVWNLTMSQYHSDICEGPSISSSGLRTIWSASPAHYFIESPYDPTPKEPEDRPHFSLGRAAHHLLFLGRKGFEDEFACRPAKWADWRTADAKLWREDAIARGLTVITDGELEQITGMARALAAHPLVKAGILDGYVERSLIWKDRQSGAWLKSRPDCIPNDSGDFADLKTTASVERESLARSIASFGYPMQGALVGMASREVLGREMQTFTLVFVESKPPHCVRVVTIKPDDIERAERQVRVAAQLFAECVATGVWPGPGGVQQDAEFLDPPEWSRKSIDDRLALYDLENP
jgi:hypothetical protein